MDPVPIITWNKNINVDKTQEDLTLNQKRRVNKNETSEKQQTKNI